MHFNFGLNAVQILWALTFAALLVLLVVLLGRDRAKRFPVFSFSIALVALRLLSSRMLYGKMSPIATNIAFLSLALVGGLVNLAVVAELARRAFAGASRKAWLVGTLILLAVGGAVVALWGPWPAWSTLTGGGMMVALRLMQLVAQRSDMLADTLAIELGILAAFAGRRFHAGWRSHTQLIILGFSTSALAQLAVRGFWQAIATHAIPHSQEEYERILGLQEKLYNANSVAYLLVLVWWIVCLWNDEPGAKTAGLEAPAELEGSTDR
jgi:asparagine N-glycosylation enzyme membrane subunit Stt3